MSDFAQSRVEREQNISELMSTIDFDGMSKELLIKSIHNLTREKADLKFLVKELRGGESSEKLRALSLKIEELTQQISFLEIENSKLKSEDLVILEKVQTKEVFSKSGKLGSLTPVSVVETVREGPQTSALQEQIKSL